MKRECPQAGAQQGEKTDTRSCYTCGQPGHISTRCPNGSAEGGATQQQRPPRTRQPRQPREQQGASAGAKDGSKDPSSKRCFICGGPHLQKDCPEAGQQGQGASSATAAARKSRGIKCYNCGESGHISKSCPKIELGPRCYSCSQFGHISSECTNAPAAAEGQNF